MILVHLPQTWPAVMRGELTAGEATLGDWAGISDAALIDHADAILGIFDNNVVSAYDIDAWTRTDEGRARFTGTPSTRWGHLLGTPSPGKPWGVKGMARPVQYLRTAVVDGGDVPVDDVAGGRRAVVNGYILTATEAGATVVVPAGRMLTVVTTNHGDHG